MAVKIVPEIKFGPDGIGLEVRQPPSLAVELEGPNLLERVNDWWWEWWPLAILVVVALAAILWEGGKP